MSRAAAFTKRGKLSENLPSCPDALAHFEPSALSHYKKERTCNILCYYTWEHTVSMNHYRVLRETFGCAGGSGWRGWRLTFGRLVTAARSNCMGQAGEGAVCER